MFTWLNSQAVKSDLGFEVESIDRYSIGYREGSMQIAIPIEFGFNGTKTCVLLNQESYDAIAEKAPSEFDQNRIRKNFADALEFQGLAVVFID